jgi:hypothetical protein
VDEDVIPVPRSPKKAKRDGSPVGRRPGEVEIEREFDFADVGEIGMLAVPSCSILHAILTSTGNILMRSLFQINSVLTSRHRTEPGVLAHHLVRAASALSQVVQQTVEQSLKRIFNDPGLLKTNLTAAARVFVLMMLGLNRLGNVGPQSIEVQGHVIYAYVHMFQNLLNNLELLSGGEATTPVVQESASSSAEKRPATSKGKSKAAMASVNSSPDKRPATSKGRAKAAWDVASSSPDKRPSTSKGETKATTTTPKNKAALKDVPSLNALTVFLSSILDHLDPKQDAHKSLFEGFAYSLLTKLGSRLYHCVFSRPRAETIEAEIAAAANAERDDIEDGPIIEDLETKKSKLEAPYLIHLLTRLMIIAPSHLGAFKTTKKGNVAKTVSLKNANKNALSIFAKERLQKTLVNCMFGTEGLQDDDELRDCLKMPVMGRKVDLPKAKEMAGQEVREWFVEEAWRLVGWEVLGKEEGIGPSSGVGELIP